MDRIRLDEARDVVLSHQPNILLNALDDLTVEVFQQAKVMAHKVNSKLRFTERDLEIMAYHGENEVAIRYALEVLTKKEIIHFYEEEQSWGSIIPF